MPKITDYPKVTSVDNANVFLMDGNNGTKGILAKDLALGLLSRLTSKEINGKTPITGLDAVTSTALTDVLMVGTSSGNKKITVENAVWALLEATATVETRRNTFRGKKLGNAITEAQYNEIDAGTFKGFFLGDYWEIGGRIWRIADFDYWYYKGNPRCTTHHLVIVSDETLITNKMNPTDNISTGYVGTSGRTLAWTDCATIINGAIGSSHILEYYDMLINGITDNGKPMVSIWTKCKYELMNEYMVYGHSIMSVCNPGDGTVPHLYTISYSQLALFKAHPHYIRATNNGYWLRDSSSNSAVCYVDSYGTATAIGAANTNGGFRLALGLKK